jgi:hypothetical protein
MKVMKAEPSDLTYVTFVTFITFIATKGILLNATSDPAAHPLTASA